MKRILTIHYSQSGQLTEIVNNFCEPIENAEFDHVLIQPKKDFPFPWSTEVFFDIMPDCVLENPIEILQLKFNHERYDLIIIAYQPWFLSPSLPITSLLKHSSFKKIIADTPVITLIGSRNMWLNSQEGVKKMIQEAGGNLIGNIALSDKTSNLISVLTIFHWMLTGKKTKKWGFLPLPGVSDSDIEGVKKFGKVLNNKSEVELLNIQPTFVEMGGVPIPTSILFIEGKAKKIFRIWANLITKKVASGGKRSFWISAFKYYLLFVLFVVSPILLTLYFIFIVPFTQKSIRTKKAYFQSVTSN